MKVYYFSEFPYHEYPDEEGEKYPSLRLTFPNTFQGEDQEMKFITSASFRITSTRMRRGRSILPCG